MEKLQNLLKNILKSGNQILVEGRIQTGSYDKEDGTKVYTTDLIVEHVYFCGSKQQNNTNNDLSEFAENSGVNMNVIGDDEPLPF